jgi:ribosome-binding protein aMBF1 (putative translation factor)
MAKTRDFARVIQRQLATNPRLAEAVERERLNATIAGLIFDARTGAGLTQKQLAERVGTHQSVIARLEDADYGGHSLNMLGKIAVALNRQLTVGLAPPSRPKATSRR